MSQSFDEHSATMTEPKLLELLEGDDWQRMPKPGQRLLGMTRTTHLEIINDPESGVKSAVIRKPGRMRGIRLIYMPSLLSYLEKLAAAEAAKQEVSA